MLLYELTQLINDNRKRILFGINEIKEYLIGEFRNFIF
jgi:hypothetical protein